MLLSRHLKKVTRYPWYNCKAFTAGNLSLTSIAAFSSSASYDYVVVGGGSAGCVMANRLSEDPSTRVLLIEAGKSDRGNWDSWKIQMPAALTYNLMNQKYNWDFFTEPQKELGGRRISQPRGKVLGGSSSLNAMAYVRGHALDYERWAKEGASNWSYADCLPYFRRSTSHELGGDDYKGDHGPVRVSRGKSGVCDPLNNAFVSAGKQAGYKITEDPNGFMQEGFGPMDMTVNDTTGERSSTSNSYIKPVLNERKNLEICTDSRVTRVIFQDDGEGVSGCTTAEGVEFINTNGQLEKVFAGEVILCLGAIQSPQLLQLSGIGDAEHLKNLDISVRMDQPEVGSNLEDHLDTYIQVICPPDYTQTLFPYATWNRPHKRISSGIDWFLRGKGVCASNHFEVGGFIRSSSGISHPDIQYHFIAGFGQLEFLKTHGFQIHCSTMRPKSRGSVNITSSNPLVAPSIDPKYFTDPEGHDIRDFRNGLRLTLELLSQPALADFVGDRLSPLPEFDPTSDEQCDDWIRSNCHSAYHPSCTNAMGKVVDTSGAVLGAKNLYVVDASIIGNLNAPTIMLAEKCADAIRGLTPLPPDPKPWYVPDEWETKQR